MTTMARIAQIRTALARVKEKPRTLPPGQRQPVRGIAPQAERRGRVHRRGQRVRGWQWINVEAVLDALPPETK